MFIRVFLRIFIISPNIHSFSEYSEPLLRFCTICQRRVFETLTDLCYPVFEHIQRKRVIFMDKRHYVYLLRCADGSLAVFAVNRSLEATAEFEIRLQDGAQPASVEAQTLHDDDLFAANTLYDQNRVTPHANGSAMYDAESGVVRVSLPPVSWTALHIK